MSFLLADNERDFQEKHVRFLHSFFIRKAKVNNF